MVGKNLSTELFINILFVNCQSSVNCIWKIFQPFEEELMIDIGESSCFSF